jgi:hypothetical protein
MKLTPDERIEVEEAIPGFFELPDAVKAGTTYAAIQYAMRRKMLEYLPLLQPADRVE